MAMVYFRSINPDGRTSGGRLHHTVSNLGFIDLASAP